MCKFKKEFRKEKPKQLETIDLEMLRNICQEYIDFVDNDDVYYNDNDYDHYIFETALTTIFGNDIFEYINKRQE